MNALRRRCHAAVAALSALLLAGCLPRTGSPEARFLQNELIPTMKAWSRTDFPRLHLYRSTAVTSFDYICALPEYREHSTIESEVPQVTTYRGAAGYELVPEMWTAIIGVKADTAHVAYVPMRELMVNRRGTRRCYPASKAILVREWPEYGIATASLEEGPG